MKPHTAEDRIVTKPCHKKTEDAESQTNIFQHKWALTADTHQNPLAKMLKWHLVLEREVSRVHQRQSDLLSLGVGQLVQRCLSVPPRKSTGWQSVPSKGKKRGGSPEQMVSAAVRNIASNPSWGQRAASSGSSQPFLRGFIVAALPHPGARYRESSASRGRPNRLAKSQTPRKRQGCWGRKIALSQRPAN